MALDPTGRSITRQATRTLADVQVSPGRPRGGRTCAQQHPRPRHQGRALDQPVGPHPPGPGRPRAGPPRRGRRRLPGPRRRGPRARRGPRPAARRDAAAPHRPVGPGPHRRRPRRAALGRPAAGAGPGRPRPARERRPGPGAGLAADVVVLADSSRLGRDAVDARLVLGHALLTLGDHDQATRPSSPHWTGPLDAHAAAGRGRPRRPRPGRPGPRPARGAAALRGRRRAPHAPQGAALGATPPDRRPVPAARAPRPGSTGTTCPPTGRTLVRPSSPGPRPHDRRPWTRSPSRRARGRRAGRRRPDQPPDRRGALRLPADRRRAPHPHLPQARHQHPRPARGVVVDLR